MTRWPSLAIVAASFLLMQIHSIAFWQGQAEGVTLWQVTVDSALAGAIWSVVVEGAALWLWWHRRTGIAVVASAILIAGPFHHLASPTLDAIRNHAAAQRLVELEQAEVKQLEASITTYEANSEKRRDWAGRIDRTQARLDAARERLRQATLQQAEQHADWGDVANVVMLAAALLVVMLTQILAVGTLRPAHKKNHPSKDQPEPRSKPQPPPAAAPSKAAPTFESDYEALVIEVSKRLESWEGQQKDLADQAGVRPADLSMIRKHRERSAAGQETVSRTALGKVADYLGIERITTGAAA